MDNRKLWAFEIEGYQGMHYRTLANNFEEAYAIAKTYAAVIERDGDESIPEVVAVWRTENIDLVTNELVEARMAELERTTRQ